MRIVWDEPKRLANIAKHGMDFADVRPEFFLLSIVRLARDGRYSAIGKLGGVVVVIFARLGGEGVSIISARPASAKERRLLK